MLATQILPNSSPAGSTMSTESSEAKSQRHYVKVSKVPCLYRHEKTGNYYAVKKVRGKHKEHSLKTTDRKIAERRLKEWIADLDKVDSEVEKTTLRQLIAKFQAIRMGMDGNTLATDRAVINSFTNWWPYGLDIQVRNIRPSQLDEWLAVQEQRGLRNTTYNRYAGFVKQLFGIAVKDRIIAESPAKSLNKPWKNPQRVKPRIPTVEQFEAIIDCVRAQPFTDHADDSADFLAFLGLAGLGQAEASALTWGDIEWDHNRMHIRRQKTDTHFYVPIYPHLRPLLEKLKRQPGPKHANRLVFKIKDGKKALTSASKKLGLPAFSQRNLRQCLIGRLWKARVDYKLIAKWQGHRDGGKLILETYTEVFADDDGDYEQQQLAKLGVSSKPNREACT